MKLNISYPLAGTSVKVILSDRHAIEQLNGYRISSEVKGEMLNKEYAGYIFKITGGTDGQGFPMMQGILTDNRTKLLLGGRTLGYIPKRSGERRRKSVRGCIVGHDISSLNLIVVERGEKDIAGLTTKNYPARRFPKRASKIRKLYNLPATEQDLSKYVVKRKVTSKSGKTKVKTPKIQRLVTKRTVAHKKRFIRERKANLVKSREALKAFREKFGNM
eukprot:gnl/Chilomastix_caulleri/1134.p1 GENE.gnl/Chilomastix_caulleri/1134~~gnl/Chilomastix_caulleri/1134.p1  ORF type:complete len:218 (+),score=58.77 gnl/Chilomastix_caulleri/1134:60-713(+)